MTVTIELKKQETLHLLRELEKLGLIRVKSPALECATTQRNPHTARWLRGYCKNVPHSSVDEFLEQCCADKEREYAIDERNDTERTRYA